MTDESAKNKLAAGVSDAIRREPIIVLLILLIGVLLALIAWDRVEDKRVSETRMKGVESVIVRSLEHSETLLDCVEKE